MQTRTELLATGDVRYHEPDRRRLADVLTAIRLRTTVNAVGATLRRTRLIALFLRQVRYPRSRSPQAAVGM
jgi:DNA polymerase III alpha subunit